MTYLLVFFTSLIFTVFLTPYLITLLKKINVVDVPGGRRIHTRIVPRMGGLVIFLVVLTMLNTFTSDIYSTSLITLSLLVLLYCGIVDDIIGLNSMVKFGFDIVSAVIMMFYFMPRFDNMVLFGVMIPKMLEYFVLLVFIVGAINSVNLLDGLDGLASGFSLLVFSTVLVFAILYNDALLIILSISLIGSVIGFLRFNAFPATVFLGDTGSLVLGYFLVLTSLMTSLNITRYTLDLTVPVMLLAVPIIDTIKVFFCRIIARKNPFSPDNNHLHHIIISSNIKHEITVFLIEMFAAVFVSLSLMYVTGSKTWATVLFVIFSVLLISVKPFLRLLRNSESYSRLFYRVSTFPSVNITFLKRFFVGMSTGLIFYIIVISFPLKSTLANNELLFLIVTCIVLLLLAYFQQQKTNNIAHINVFLNISIFFIVSKLSLPDIKLPVYYQSVFGKNIHELSFFILVVLLVMFLFARGKILPGRPALLSGIDLIMIVFVLLTFVLNKVLNYDFNCFLSISLLEAFVLYIWYKIIINIKTHLTKLLSYLSYALPLAALLVLYTLKSF